MCDSCTPQIDSVCNSPSYIPRLIEIANALKDDRHVSGRHFHVSFLMKKRKIVKIGINSYEKRSPVSATYHSTKSNHGTEYIAGIHSEQSVLGKMKGRDLGGHTLVNIRINGEGKLGLAKPCPNCAWYLGKTNLRKVIYSNGNGTFGEFTS
jgi:deoxycytidylate deaminase